MGHSINRTTCREDRLQETLGFIHETAFDPMETSCYHGNMTIHKTPIYDDYDCAYDAIEEYDDGWYSDHAVRYRDGDEIRWLVKYEYHC